MPKIKRPLETTRTSSRRQASKEALKQMQLLLDDEEEDAFVIPDDDDDKDVRLETHRKRTISPIIEPPPKKKYKLSHRKSSDGNDRDVIVLKSISNSNYVPKENTLELECFIEELSDVQKERRKKVELEEKELQTKLDELMKGKNSEVVYKGEFNSAVEVNELISNNKKSLFKPSQLPQLGKVNEDTPTYQLVMDPRLGIIVGTVQKPPPQPQMPPPPLAKSKLQISSAVKAVATIPQTQTPPTTRNTRGRRGASSAPTTPVQTRANNAMPTRAANAMPTRGNNAILTRATNAMPTRGNNTTPTRGNNIIPTRGSTPAASPARAAAQVATPSKAAAQTVNPTRAAPNPPRSTPNPPRSTPNPPRSTPNPPRSTPNPPRATPQVAASPARGATQTTSPTPQAVQTRAMKSPAMQTRNSKTTPTGKRPVDNAPAEKTKQVVDLTSDDNRSQVDNREISFNKLQGKTYPSLVVVARPHLRVSDLGADRSKLDSKVKSLLMHPPTKFTEWLIQQGLIRAEQKCPVHSNTQLKLGMYSDVSKFPFSGGYVWISECCPQRFISVFNGSIFEGSPNPPMVMLKLIYHWSCQTNIQNVTQWVKVDNLYVKGIYTWLRGICTVAVQTRIRQLGGPGCRVEVGVISLGTTSHDGNQRQVKVEVLGILESSSKFMRLRAVEPMPDGDRNFRKKFSKILEPILLWVHPSSTIVTDLTVDKTTLHHMGFTNVIQTTSNDYNNSNRTIMEYLRRIVPRMFQNTLSLLSRQIIQQFLDELVWREWFGITAQQAFDNILAHLAEQTRTNTQPSLIIKLNKVATNPFKSWNNASGVTPAANNAAATPVATNPTPNTSTVAPVKTPVTEVKRYGRGRKSNSPQVPVVQERPTKPVSPDVPEQMVPLENYYYGTIESFDKPSTKVKLSMKCPFCKSSFDNNLQLQDHLFKHAHNVSNDAYLCRYCLTSVSTANELLYHNNLHPTETKFDNGFVCLICETHYMNPFVLGKHMSKEHSPHELPYECGTCSFRCSNHKQIIDHFYLKHDGGTTIQCPFCLKSTTVWSGGRNIAQNIHYFIQHLQKHQKKQLAKRCGKCNLWFVQKEVLKDHQQKMHVSLRGRLGLVPYSSPRNGVMVPKSKVDKNPCDAEIINFSSLYYNIPTKSVCKECEQVIASPKHFPSFDSCQNPNCQYSTCCAIAMMTHNAKCKGLNAVIPPETLPFEMFCVCGHKDFDGNSMAKHLAICEKKSAYPSQTDAKSATVMHSMLDILGLVRKPEEVPPSKTKDKKEAAIDGAISTDDVCKKSEKIENSNEISILSDDEETRGDKIDSNQKPVSDVDTEIKDESSKTTKNNKDDSANKKADIVEVDEDVPMEEITDTEKNSAVDVGDETNKAGTKDVDSEESVVSNSDKTEEMETDDVSQERSEIVADKHNAENPLEENIVSENETPNINPEIEETEVPHIKTVSKNVDSKVQETGDQIENEEEGKNETDEEERKNEINEEEGKNETDEEQVVNINIANTDENCAEGQNENADLTLKDLVEDENSELTDNSKLEEGNNEPKITETNENLKDTEFEKDIDGRKENQEQNENDASALKEFVEKDNSKLEESNESEITEQNEGLENMEYDNQKRNRDSKEQNENASTLIEPPENEDDFQLDEEINEPEITAENEDLESMKSDDDKVIQETTGQNENAASTLSEVSENENDVLGDNAILDERNESEMTNERSEAAEITECDEEITDEKSNQESDESSRDSITETKKNGDKESIKENESNNETRIENKSSEEISQIESRIDDINQEKSDGDDVAEINTIEDLSGLNNPLQQEDESLNKVNEEENINIEEELGVGESSVPKEDVSISENIEKVGINNINHENYQSLNEGLCKESISKDLHEDALNDFLSTDNVTPMNVDLESELSDIGVGAPMQVE